MRLGLLDLCTVRPGATHADALVETLELAPLVEALGFSRYWLAEHHSPLAAHGCPELFAAVVAGVTERIRVGTAGVLLPFHSALKVAESFRLLQTLYRGRIDLGFGAGSAEPAIAAALLDGRAPRMAEKVDELLGWLQRSDGPASFAAVGLPEVWTLSSGGASVVHAARSGTALALSLFLRNSRVTPAAVDAYAAEFVPGAFAARPRWSIAVAGVCGDSDADAEAQALAWANPAIVPSIVGDAARCAGALAELAARYRTEELVFVDVAADASRRRRGLERLAQRLL